MSRGGPYKHGHTVNYRASKEYNSWAHIVQRCTNPKHKNWDRYGGRGISICVEWMEFDQFIKDVGFAPSALHTIDRIDNDGPYEPGNVRWATRQEQAKNRKGVYRIEVDGTQYTLRDYCNVRGISYSMVCQRMHRHGLTWEEACTRPR